MEHACIIQLVDGDNVYYFAGLTGPTMQRLVSTTDIDKAKKFYMSNHYDLAKIVLQYQLIHPTWITIITKHTKEKITMQSVLDHKSNQDKRIEEEASKLFKSHFKQLFK